VIVEAEVFRAAPAPGPHSDLLALFRLGMKNYHTIEVEPDDSPAFLKWLDTESDMTSRMCKHALNHGRKHRSRHRQARTVRVADVQEPSWPHLRLPLQTALRLLERPLRLLLENSRNDRNFLAVITRLHEGFDLRRLEDERIVEVQTNGGVDENRKWIEAHGSAPIEMVRLWVMCDSDARREWRDTAGKSLLEQLGKGARLLANVCNQRKIPLHVLSRRAIENYLPLPVLHHWSAHDPAKRENLCKAFAKLSAEQRHHYNMKKGFHKDDHDQEHAAKLGDLYRTLDPDTRQTLEGGFDDSIAELFGEILGHIRQGWLIHDQQAEEARRIAEAILEHL
jgi:hypothetical protein